MELPANKKIYFASDFHLGLPNHKESIKREKLICNWLDEIKSDAHTIYLVGDLFDVWFEYKNVIPKGYIRFLGKLAELSDAGIYIHIFTGNHDLWMNNYLAQEIAATIHTEPITVTYNDKKFFIGHGDGLGPGDNGYKFLKKVMSNKLSQWLYRRIHPDTGVAIADYFSKKGPKHQNEDHYFLGPEKEWLILFANDYIQNNEIDYFIFGHRHLAMTYLLSNKKSFYINLGDWLHFNTYGVFEGNNIQLLQYPQNTPYVNKY
jgi:UDP-2,3-diacylglucosamine hydrolase